MCMGNREGKAEKRLQQRSSTCAVSHDGQPIYALRRNEQPEALAMHLSIHIPTARRALPPVGWLRTWAQLPQRTTDWACEKTVVMAKQPGHLTSMKNEFGLCTTRLSLCWRASTSGEGLIKSTARGCGRVSHIQLMPWRRYNTTTRRCHTRTISENANSW